MKNILTRSLNTKLIAFFMITSMIPMATISVISYTNSQASLEKRAFDQLHTLASDRASALQKIDDLRKQQLGQVSSTSQIIDVLSKDKSDFSELDDILENIKTNTGGENGFHNFKIVANNGIIQYAQDRSLIGKSLSDDKFFKNGLDSPYQEIVQDNGNKVSMVSYPITDIKTHERYGVLIAQTATTIVDATLLDRVGLGETGETYLVSSDRIMITPSRFHDGYEFHQKADTLPVKQCFDNGKSIDAEIYPDYRDVPIYGSSHCDKESGYVLIAEYDVAEIEAPIVALQNMYLVTGGIIAGAVGTFAYFISRSISRPIKTAAQVAQKISQGDLTVKVLEPKSQDEVGTLIMAEKQMVDNLRQIVSEVHGATQSVSASSQQIAASGTEMNSAVQQIATTVDQISRGSQTQAQNLEKSKSLVEELATNIGNLATSASESEKIAEEVGSLSLQGSESAKEAGQRMNKIIAVTNESAEKVKGLAAKTNEITTVLDVIRQIADQTNLLALNAAIEAARAGEAGRGFAVVADEVRRLAESSAKSSEEIGAKLLQIQEDAQDVVKGIETSANEVNQGKQVIDSSLMTLETIANNVKTVSENVKKLTESAYDQVANAKVVQTNAGEIAAVAEENAAATEEASAAVEEQTAQTQEIATASNQMAELAEQLNRTIAKFKIDNTSKNEDEPSDKTAKLSGTGSKVTQSKKLLTKLVRK